MTMTVVLRSAVTGPDSSRILTCHFTHASSKETKHVNVFSLWHDPDSGVGTI